MGDFLAPWHIIILLIVLVLLFGSRRLPGAAKSLGESMHIFKKSVQGLNPDDSDSAANPSGQPMASTLPPSLPPPSGLDATQQQLADLQRQVAELQRQATAPAGAQPDQAQTPQPF